MARKTNRDGVMLYPKTVNGSMFVVGAFRYALGRRSYAVGCVASELIRIAPVLGSHTRELIVREIQDALDRDMAGMEYDRETWKEVASILKPA